MEVSEPALIANTGWKQNPVMRALITLLAVQLIANIGIIIFSDARTSVLYSTSLFFRMIGYNDSWVLMNHALQYLHSPPLQHLFMNQSVYQVIFFDQQLKFIYPLTSILVLEPLRLMYGGAAIPDNVLNGISWVLLLGFAIIVILIFRIGVRRSLGNDYSTVVKNKGFMICSILLVFMFFPVIDAFVLGQIQTWINFLFALAVLCWLQDRKKCAGICIGLICIIKPQFLLFLCWGVVRKQWRFAVGVVIILILFGGISVAVYGWQNNTDYVRVVSYIGQYGESCYANQSFNGLLHRILFNGDNLQWDEHHYAPYHPVVLYGTIITSVVLIGLGLFKWNRNDSKYNEVIDFCIGALCFTMASPVAWGHHYGVLLPILAIAGPMAIHQSSKEGKKDHLGLVLLGLSYILVSNNFYFFNGTAGSYFNIVQSYILIGTLLLLWYLISVQRSKFFPGISQNLS